MDLDECIERLYKKELLAESVVEAICAKTKELLMKESNVVHIAAPVTVVGDIHGQFFDMIEIFKIGGSCPDTNYLFLGMILPYTMPGRRAKMSLYSRRLRGSRSIQCGNNIVIGVPEVKVSTASALNPWKPRISWCDSVIWVLHRVLSEVW